VCCADRRSLVVRNSPDGEICNVVADGKQCAQGRLEFF